MVPETPFHVPKSSSGHLLRRKLVTLFVGFRCAYAGNPEEKIFVICADSQETIEEKGASYRVTVQKIKPEKFGNFDLAIGGSAASAKLIEACVYSIQEAVSGFNGTNLSDLKKFISKHLLEFGKNDAKLYSKKERVSDLLIMARSILDSAVECWYTKASQLLPIKRKILVGWNEKIYKQVLDRLYPETGRVLPPQQAVLLGMHILKLAEDTSNYVRGPITVVVGHSGTIQELPADRVDKFQERIDLFRAQMDSLFLSIADHTIGRPTYEKILEEFKATALQLRDDCVQESAPKNIEEIVNTNDVIPNLPRGIVMKFGVGGVPTKISEDPLDVARWRKRIEFIKITAGHGPILLTIHCPCQKVFEVELPNFQAISGREFQCECGQKTSVPGVEIEDVRLKENAEPEPRVAITEKNDFL